MALTKELIKILDEDDEPVKKRLKIADNAFRSQELPIPCKEFLLLKWAGSTKSKEDVEVWTQCYQWISSEQFKGINRNEIKFEDYNNVVEVMLENLKSTQNASIKALILNCLLCIIKNTIFHQHFKFDMENYLTYVSEILPEICDSDMLSKFIKNTDIFHRIYVEQANFHTHFIELIVPSFATVAAKFSENDVFSNLSRQIQVCIFQSKSKQFQKYMKTFFSSEAKETESTIPESLFKKLNQSYALDDKIATFTFKLVFDAVCKCYNTNFDIVYKFCILTTSSLGFGVNDTFGIINAKRIKCTQLNLNTTLKIYSEILQSIKKDNNDLECAINKITFETYLQNMTKSVISLSKEPNEVFYEILLCVIDIHPLLIEKMIDEIMIYMLLSDNKDCRASFEKTFVAILNVFAKLHRVQNFISKLILVLKSDMENDAMETGELFVFKGDVKINSIDLILPISFLDRFTECITLLASWQVMNLYKTLLYHLNGIFENNLQEYTVDNRKILYVEFICTLLAHFLASVRIAEHTVSKLILDKFVLSMEEQYGIFKKFGSSLVHMEHNHRLMRCYLKMCYNWAELYMVIKYYCDNETKIQFQLVSDYSACNITYLHAYLSAEHWCLISQRITNFGEKPCKEIMYKLCIQKLRALSIFEQDIHEDMYTSIIKMITNSISDLYENVISDPFTLSTILPKMDRNELFKLSECVLKDVIDHGNYAPLKNIGNCKIFSKVVIFNALTKINQLFQSQKRQDTACIKLANELLKDDALIDDFELSSKSDFISDCLSLSIVNYARDFKLNEQKVLSFLEVIKCCPVIYLEINIQSILFVYLTAVVKDLMKLKLVTNIRTIMENIILGILQNGSINVLNLMKPNIFINLITQNFNGYITMFECLLDMAIKNEKNFKSLKTGISLLTKDIAEKKNMECCISLLKFTNKHKKSKLQQEIKTLLEKYKSKVCETIMNNIDEIDKLDSIEGITIVLKMYLSSDDDEQIDKFKGHLQKYIDKVFKKNTNEIAVKGWISLFVTIFQYKAKFEDIVQEDFILKVWNLSHRMVVNDEDVELHSKLLIAIFEHISNEQFQIICNDLLSETVAFLKENNFVGYRNSLQIWNSILGCHFNPTKLTVWQNCIQKHLLQICYSFKQFVNDDVVDEIIKFQINILNSTHILLTPAMMDAFFYTISYINMHSNNFAKSYAACVLIMESLLKHRKHHTTDRIPSYLQQYRNLVKSICNQANADANKDSNELRQISDCAHSLEKLTNKFTTLEKHFSSVAMYVIADILKQYETITLDPSVKIHLNNCLFVLIGMCDQHAISCLLRVLSTASSAIFKLLHTTYKKYYRFTGKV